MRLRPMAVVALVAALLTAAAVGGGAVAPRGSAAPLPNAKQCDLFPRSLAFNRRVDRLPVAANSPRIVRSIGLDRGLKADFGSGTYEGRPIGIPYDVVSRMTPRANVRFEYAGESDRVTYPIPQNVHIEGGSDASGDRHALLLDRDRCRLFELFSLRHDGRRWTAGSGATWNLRSSKLRPAGRTSADAAGLPILPLLARPDEVARGRIDHALRVTVRRSRRAYVHPARHFASSDNDTGLPRMGERLRLRNSFDVSRLPRQARIVATALKRYGLIVADNGADWFISGVPSARWDNDDLRALGRIRGRDFYVVDARALRPRR